MPIDFFALSCNNTRGNCQTESIHCLQHIQHVTFGISDADGANSVPAKVNAENPDPTTDLIVCNHSNIPVCFKAVDWCVDIYRTGTYKLGDENRDAALFSSDSVYIPGNELIKRCEGFLQYGDSIVFIEIKNIGKIRGNWIKDAREKFEETILSFKEHHPDKALLIVKPILSNPSFPGPHPNEAIQKRILKDKIGIEFVRQDRLEI